MPELALGAELAHRKPIPEILDTEDPVCGVQTLTLVNWDLGVKRQIRVVVPVQRKVVVRVNLLPAAP